MNALGAHCNAMNSAMRNGRAGRTCVVRPQAVAVPRKMAHARPLARTEKATLTAAPVTLEVETATRIVHTVTAEKYHDFLAEHGDKLIAMDFYTTWCGPCKVIAPELERMAAESDPARMVFAKMDCGATNESKRLAMSLAIKALPTFHLYRNGSLLDSMTGARVKALEELIAKHL